MLLLAALLCLSPATAQAAACVDNNDNGVCNGGDTILNATTFQGAFVNPLLVESGTTLTCVAPFFGFNVTTPKITVKGTLECLFGGANGIFITTTNVGIAGPPGIIIDGGVLRSGGGIAVKLNSGSTISVTNGIIEGLFLGSNVEISSNGNQTYSGATVNGPNFLSITSLNGTITASGGGPDPCDTVVPITLPVAGFPNPLLSAADRDAWHAALLAANPGKTLDQLESCLCFNPGLGNKFLSSDTGSLYINFTAGGSQGKVDLSGAQVQAGALIFIKSKFEEVKLIGACVENVQGPSPCLAGALTAGGEIYTFSGIGKTIDITNANIREGKNLPAWNNIETCTSPNAGARLVGVPNHCE
jgi:hypothetical protein